MPCNLKKFDTSGSHLSATAIVSKDNDDAAADLLSSALGIHERATDRYPFTDTENYIGSIGSDTSTSKSRQSYSRS